MRTLQILWTTLKDTSPTKQRLLICASKTRARLCDSFVNDYALDAFLLRENSDVNIAPRSDSYVVGNIHSGLSTLHSTLR